MTKVKEVIKSQMKARQTFTALSIRDQAEVKYQVAADTVRWMFTIGDMPGYHRRLIEHKMDDGEIIHLFEYYPEEVQDGV